MQEGTAKLSYDKICFFINKVHELSLIDGVQQYDKTWKIYVHQRTEKPKVLSSRYSH